MFRFALIILLLAGPAAAQETVILGLSQNRVAITANFDGSEILVFGAVKREVKTPDYAPLEIIIEVTGPPKTVVVRRKERVLGIWVNRDSVRFPPSPSFYALATTGELNDILSEADDQRYRIRIATQINMDVKEGNTLNLPEFRDSIIRIRNRNGLFAERIGTVRLNDETLFETRISLPSNLVEGDYRTRVFLIRNKQVVDDYQTVIAVRKVGLERWIYNLAQERPLIYGLLSLAIAILAGWTASAIFRVLRLT
jgi:uncharacterized protein (TIGR02186 family)